MESKSLEQYMRELMDMYRAAIAKNPAYAELVRASDAVSAPPEAVAETPSTMSEFAAESETVIEPVFAPVNELEPATVPVVLPVIEPVFAPVNEPVPATVPVVLPVDEPVIEPAPEPAPETIVEIAPNTTPKRKLPNLGMGSLVLNVTTDMGLLPIEGAKVTVSHIAESGNKVVAQVVTDSNGKTDPVLLPAPPKDRSEYPQPIKGQGVPSQYIVTVEAPGYVTATDENVLIFDGVTSMQSIDMLAISEADGSTQPNDIE